MKKSILEVYALAVCFAAIACSAVALGVASYNVIEIINPEFTLNAQEYNRHQSNDAFWKGRHNIYSADKREEKRPPEEELTKLRLESYQQALKSERRDAFKSLTKAIIIIIIDIVFFVVHWRIARRAREASIAT
jgi:hypothetical protein